ncbi:serine hydrolase domain-containing protein [Aquimarina aquimarini]|uniref:serine hydrolase domain-containing protein n=1 Tax=Aquimarina aquimarini TaxID=1191734 RepID=UPI000D557859|nr:serine hydrolase domain-containing protein [Aquimarina aquimarini]
MKNKIGLLFITLLVITISSFAQQKENHAPKVTTAEAELSFWDIPYLEKAFIDTAPQAREDNILVGKLGVDGGNKAMVLKLAQEIIDTTLHGDYDALLISHKNKLIFESYYRKGRVDLLHPQASATKAYTSLLLGRAIQLGYLSMADLDKPLIGFLTELDTKDLAKGAEKITLHKALIMHGGLGISEEQRKNLEKPSSKLKGQGFVQTLLEYSTPITPETQVYKYGNYNPILVMQVIDAVVPGSVQDFIKKELLDKLGITNYQWKNAVSGQPEAGWRVSLKSRDMLKLGSLVANKGKWNGEQLISGDYLAKAISNITKPTQDWIPQNYNYGYFFYQTDITVGDKNYSTSFAWGGGGQYIITVEELDLVIVINGHDREDTIMTQVSKVIIPAFVK